MSLISTILAVYHPTPQMLGVDFTDDLGTDYRFTASLESYGLWAEHILGQKFNREDAEEFYTWLPKPTAAVLPRLAKQFIQASFMSWIEIDQDGEIVVEPVAEEMPIFNYFNQ